MSIIYFTNNADKGDGSLCAAIMSAKDGDVIRPDESVFERGSTIEILLASTLTIDKTLTLDGGRIASDLTATVDRDVALSQAASALKLRRLTLLAADGILKKAPTPVTQTAAEFTFPAVRRSR